MHGQQNIKFFFIQGITQSRPLSITVIKTNQLMIDEAKISVFFEIRTKRSMQREHYVEFFNIKPCGK
jgi:hypothetical protein